MKLADQLESLEILRATAEPDGSKPVCIVVPARELQQLMQWLSKRKQLKISHIFIADLPEGTPLSIHLPAAHGKPSIEAGLGQLANVTGSDVLFFSAPEWVISAAAIRARPLANQQTFLAGSLAPQLQPRKPLPDYYATNSANLEEAWALLATDADRESFARRVKALVSGDPAYLLLAPHAEYAHPLIGPAPGDVMVDGGLSDMVWAQERFAQIVGPSGAIHGFEPIEWMAKAAAEQLRAFPWYHVHTAGVASKDGSAEFSDLRDSSCCGTVDGAKLVKCRLESIDSFVAREKPGPISCIKLDVEGAELDALKGAAETIARDRPKLIICLYHKPRDLYEIPLYIKNLVGCYKMHLAHSSAGFTDTILYAAPEEKLPKN